MGLLKLNKHRLQLAMNYFMDENTPKGRPLNSTVLEMAMIVIEHFRMQSEIKIVPAETTLNHVAETAHKYGIKADIYNELAFTLAKNGIVLIDQGGEWMLKRNPKAFYLTPENFEAVLSGKKSGIEDIPA